MRVTHIYSEPSSLSVLRGVVFSAPTQSCNEMLIYYKPRGREIQALKATTPAAAVQAITSSHVQSNLCGMHPQMSQLSLYKKIYYMTILYYSINK